MKKLADRPQPLFEEVRALIVAKCNAQKQKHIRDIFEKQAFGELERLVTQKLLDVTKRITNAELKNETWLRTAAKVGNRSYEEMRTAIFEFLDTDVFKTLIDHYSAFLDPLVESWDIDLGTFAMEIVLNQRLTSTQLTKLQFVEMEPEAFLEEEPGFKEFLANPAMNGDATEKEIEFLRGLRFTHRRPSALY